MDKQRGVRFKTLKLSISGTFGPVTKLQKNMHITYELSMCHSSEINYLLIDNGSLTEI